MVAHDTDAGFPDPGNGGGGGDEALPPAGDVLTHRITETDTEDEEADHQHLGYRPLPLGDYVESSHSEEEDAAVAAIAEAESERVEEQGDGALHEAGGLPSISQAEFDLLRDVWSGQPPAAADIEMDSSKVDEVKQLMQSITLPQSSIPAWAHNIPEDEWKRALIEKLQQMNGK